MRLVCFYLTEGKSLNGTAALLQLAGSCSISKKAVFRRFQTCGEWLRWLYESIYRNHKAIGEPPEWVGDRRVYLVDAGDEPVHGSDKADYRLHYTTGLFDLGIKEMALTRTEPGDLERRNPGGPFGDKTYINVSIPFKNIPKRLLFPFFKAGDRLMRINETKL